MSFDFYIDSENCEYKYQKDIINFKCTLPTQLKTDGYTVALAEFTAIKDIFEYQFQITTDDVLQFYPIQLTGKFRLKYGAQLGCDTLTFTAGINSLLMNSCQQGYMLALGRIWFNPDKIKTDLKHSYNTSNKQGDVIFFYNEHEQKYMLHQLSNKSNFAAIVTSLQNIFGNTLTKGSNNNYYYVNKTDFQNVVDKQLSKLNLHVINCIPTLNNYTQFKALCNNDERDGLFFLDTFYKNQHFYAANTFMPIIYIKLTEINDHTFYIENNIGYNITISNLEINGINETLLAPYQFYTLTERTIISISSNIIDRDYYTHSPKNILQTLHYNQALQLKDGFKKYCNIKTTYINTINITLQSLIKKTNLIFTDDNKFFIRLHFKPKNELE